MNLNEYQEKAMATCMPSCENFSYMMLNLVGEVGELASKVGKAIRKKEVSIRYNEAYYLHTDLDDAKQFDNALMLEAGDVLWQLSGLCTMMGWKLEDVGQANLDKLTARAEAGTIDGNGDGIIREK